MMQYIHKHFGEKISLEDIAEQAVVSKSTALNLFRRYLHDTPVHYLLKYRLQESASLLVTTQKKVMVIAQNVGFENVDYFCKMFKKYYKMTPTEYREKHITKVFDIWKEVIGFANADGGVVYVGIRKDGAVIGVEDPDSVMLQIVNSY